MLKFHKDKEIIMNIIITDTALNMSMKAAEMIVNEVNNHPTLLLALSTGSTPVGCYQEIVKMYQNGKVDFSQARCLNMDEYIGLDHYHHQGYYYFMNHHLYQHVNFKPENLFGPCTISTDHMKAAEEFDRRIEDEGGIDLILLGIGRDGHIAFNMPQDELCLDTHIQQLSKATLQDNARFFKSLDEVPTQAMTIGIQNLFRSKKIIMLASGESKSQIIKKLIEENTIDTHVPASLLKLHPHFTLIMDNEAAKLLKK